MKTITRRMVLGWRWALLLVFWSWGVQAFDPYSGVKFFYVDKRDRQRTLRSYCENLADNYVYWNLKAPLVGGDSRRFCDQWVEAEATIEDPNNSQSLDQAEANLAFFDRVRRLNASFQDSHLTVEPMVDFLDVALPFDLIRADGKIVVRNLMKSYFTGKPPLEVGDEVLSIGGESVQDGISRLAAYIPGSSRAAVEEDAIVALTTRDFAFPQKADIQIIFKKRTTGLEEKLGLRWFFRQPPGAAEIRGDLRIHLYANHFQPWRQKDEDWNKGWQLYNPAKSMKHLQGIETYFNAADMTISLRAGVYVQDKVKYGVLQIFSFDVEEVFQVVNKKAAKSVFLDAIRTQIKRFKRAGVPLILDLRPNLGGYQSHPSVVLSMLALPGAKYTNVSLGYRVSYSIRHLMEMSSRNPVKIASVKEALEAGLPEHQFLDILSDAINAKPSREWTDWVTLPEIVAEKGPSSVGGYSEKIVALIGSDCVSACDLFAHLLRSSGRARLMGSATNGAGGGYISRGKIDTSWALEGGFAKVKIPNMAAGRPIAGASLSRHAMDPMLVSLENKPAMPQVKYENTYEDLVHGDIGWLRKAVSVLNSPKTLP